MARARSIAIIGSGAAGLMAAIRASQQADCILITDGPVGRSNSMMAQGGLQLPLPTAESRQRFFEDIVRSARVPVDDSLVRNFILHVGETIEQLESWGLELDRDPEGHVVRRLAGGLSEPRIVSVRDQIGPAIIKVLRQRVQGCELEIRDHTEVVDLVPADGGFLIRTRSAGGKEEETRTGAVICCTGGITYREALRRQHPTTNPANINHVLFDVLLGLGLTPIHADFFQYQPFGIVGSERGDLGKCVPESIVNFDVRILDANRKPIGDIRQDRYALTQRMFELAGEGRAVRLEDGTPGFWLTLSSVPDEKLASVFPKVYQYLERTHQIGQDILIYPFLHYYLGGLKMNARCESEIPGLFLAGEIAGGLHGRNRLMGNGITDSLVHGPIAARSACEFVAAA